MSLCVRIYVLVAALAVVLQLVSAASAPPRPIKRIAHPTTHALELLPRRSPPTGNYGRRSFPIDSPTLQHTDSFRLKLSAFGDTFHLHLRPNEHLIHPAARINYYRLDSDGRSVLSHTEPLIPENVRAYWGEVIHPDVSATRMREDAAGVWRRPSEDVNLGWARITVHSQGDDLKNPLFEGAFSANGVVHHVMTKDNYLKNKHQLDPQIQVADVGDDSDLIIWRDSDIMTPKEYHVAVSGGLDDGPMPIQPPRTCAHDTLSYNTNPLENPSLRKPPVRPFWGDPFGFWDEPRGNHSSTKRDDVAGGGVGTNFVNTIGNTAGCPSTQKVVYMGVASDCAYTRQYGSVANATQQIITNFNTASALYKSTFNISLGIVELQIQSPQCPPTPDPALPWNRGCEDGTVTLNDRLSLFSGWRGQKGNDGAGLWHLMSGCPTGTEVGIAWLSTLCRQTASGRAPSIVSGTAVSTFGRVEWQVISHEVGHNFGAIHDCADGCQSDSSQCCPRSRDSCNANSEFLMSPVAQTSEMKFSPCTMGNICSLMLTQSNTSCLVDASSAQRTISLQMCGNGIVEDGEECDPGAGSSSPCCDASTCKFRAGALCDPNSSSCCTQQCNFAPSTQICRPSKDGSCDMAETCTGNSSACPSDKFAPNGQSCGSNGLACANGICTSLDKQCQTVGASMNLREACPQADKSCQVSCQDPRGINQCILLQSALIDGSPCGFGGTCISGVCQSGSFLETAKSWFRRNLQISIPVTIVVGIVVLLIIYALIRAMHRCATGRRNKRGKVRRLNSWTTGDPAMIQRDSGGSTRGPNYPTPPSRVSHNQHSRGPSWGEQRLSPPDYRVPGSPAHRPTRSADSGYGAYQSHYAPQFPVNSRLPPSIPPR